MTKTIQHSDLDGCTADIRGKVLAITREISQLKLCDINELTSFREIGFDSLDMLALITQCEATFGVSLPDKLVARLGRMDELISAIVHLKEVKR